MKRIIPPLLFFASLGAANAAITITASDLDYGISNTQSNVYHLDFTTQPIWTAGSQRSDNSFQNNQRSGRVFVEFQLTTAIIAEANMVGATVSLSFDVDSIGGGVLGTPYTDGLDLRYFGVTAGDKTVNSLWNTGGLYEQSDILTVGGPTGSSTVGLTAPTLVANIAGATAGDWIAFGYLNSVGTLGATYPVGGSTGETYGFQINQTLGSHSLTVAVPEPSSSALLGLGGLAFVLHRRK